MVRSDVSRRCAIDHSGATQEESSCDDTVTRKAATAASCTAAGATPRSFRMGRVRSSTSRELGELQTRTSRSASRRRRHRHTGGKCPTGARPRGRHERRCEAGVGDETGGLHWVTIPYVRATGRGRQLGSRRPVAQACSRSDSSSTEAQPEVIRRLAAPDANLTRISSRFAAHRL
jgi:hypothetical protein